MCDGSNFDVLLQKDSEDGQMVFSLFTTHDLLHRAKPDIVFVVDVVALEPAVKVLCCSAESMKIDDSADEVIVHTNFQDVLK